MSVVRGQPDGQSNRLLIIAPLKYAGAIPFFVSFLEFATKRGFRIDLVVPEHLDPGYRDSIDDISLVTVRQGTTGVTKYVRLFCRYVTTCRRLLARNHYAACFGLSQLGIIIGALSARKNRSKLIYLNDELWFNDYEQSVLYYPLKCLEIWSCRRADLIVTQDANRGRILALINNLAPKKLLYLPNSSIGSASAERSDSLHRMLGVPSHTKIVLWNGAATPGDGALKIAELALDWTDEWLFVIHFRSSGTTEYKRRLTSFDGKGRNAYLDRQFSIAELPAVFASAHIGVSFYPDRGINARYIGSSSGKINSFLKAGVPCIVSALPGLRWVEKTGSGVTIQKPEGVDHAKEHIDAAYDTFSGSARRTFDRILKADASLESLVAWL